jgi:hypothetical protein
MDPETIIERLHPIARQLLLAISYARGVDPLMVVTHCRPKPIAHARHEWWAACYGRFPHWSYPFLANQTGHDHTSVMTGIRKHWMRAYREMPIGPGCAVANASNDVGREKCA